MEINTPFSIYSYQNRISSLKTGICAIRSAIYPLNRVKTVHLTNNTIHYGKYVKISFSKMPILFFGFSMHFFIIISSIIKFSKINKYLNFKNKLLENGLPGLNFSCLYAIATIYIHIVLVNFSLSLSNKRVTRDG